jgi:hypothetical protein
VNANTWYQLMVKVYSSNVDVYKDGALQIHAVNSSLASGQTALYGEGNTKANFSTFLIRKFAASEPTSTVGALFFNAAVSSLTLNPASVVAGNNSQGTVTLNGVAPSGGLIVNLSSSNTAAAQVPASVTVQAGASSAVFTITTANVSATTADITASYSGSSKMATLTISSSNGLGTYRSLVTVANPGGTTLTGFQVHVILGASFDYSKAQATGADVRFTASDGTTMLPFWIESWSPTSSSASLWVKVPTIDSVNGATLYMYYGNSTASSASNGNSTFDFFDDFSLGSIDSTKWTVNGGTWSVINGTEPNGLSGSIAHGVTNRPPNQILYSTSFTGSDYIFEAYGQQLSGRHWGLGTRVNGPTNFYSTNLYADLNTTNNLYEYKWLNNNGTANAIRLNASAVGAINLNTWYKLRVAVHGSSIDVYLNDLLKLQTSDTQWSTGGVAIFGGESMSANFAYVRVRQFAATEPGATVGGTTIVGGVSVSALALNPTSPVGGNNSQGTVTLNGAAPGSGAVVTLSSSNTTAAQVPANASVAAGATSATFTITTSAVTSSTNSIITASYNGTSQTATLTVLPQTKVSSLTLNPVSVVGGTNSQGTVTLNVAAPTGGISVALSSDNVNAQVPASVIVPANSSSAVFTVTTSSVSSQNTANITATYNASSQAALTIVTSSASTFRNAITISNPGGVTLSAYQVHVTLGPSFDFTKTRPNGADIRFTAADGFTGLPFWIESWNPTASSASIWVKVPTIDSANGATLYMYYGNSNAASASNGNSTFDFFDDFSLGSLDSTKWTANGGTWSVINGTEPNGLSGSIAHGVTVRPPNQILYSTSFTSSDYIFEAYGQQLSGRHWGIGTRVNGPTNLYSANLYADLNTTNNLYQYKWLNNDGTMPSIRLGFTAVGAISLNTWYKLRMAVHGPSIDVYLNDVLKLQTSDGQWSSGGVAIYGGENMTANFAYVRARKYAATEPSSSAGQVGAVTTPQAVVSPGTLSYGPQAVATSSAAQMVTVNNVGPVSLAISSISITGDFSQTNNCPASLGPGLGCTVNVTFLPSTTGTRNGTLTVTDNAPSGSQSVALSGYGGGTIITVKLTPRVTVVNFTKTQQFTATVTGTPNTAINWYVDNIAGGSAAVGTIDASGLYTPPTAIGSHTITAISAADTGASATATLYVSNSGGVFTYHNDNMRSGVNASETVLTPSKVNSTQFGKLFSLAVDGQVFGQPLYVPSLTIGSQVHNVLFVATEHDSVYAWDADTASTTPLWQTSFINPGAGITPLPCGEAAGGIGDCGAIYPEFGITSTPVIDSATGTIYVVANTKEVSGNTTNYVYRLHALSITTGAEKFGGPVAIQATASSSSGTVTFSAGRQLQRPGLLLSNGVVYIGFGSHGDSGPWYGWMMGYNASTLQQVMAFNTAPNAGAGGVWQSGAAPASDASGGVYFNTGNGAFNVNTGGVDYGDSTLKLNPNGTVGDYFTPTNQAVFNSSDNDIGAGSHVLLPDQPGPVPHIMITAGKPGVIYVLNRDNMGKYSSVADNSLQSLAALTSGPSGGGLFGSPAYWNNFVYFNAWNDFLKAFQFNSSNDTLTLSSNSLTKLAYPGATPSVSANGNTAGILWIVQGNMANNSVITNPPTAVLRAYDATNVATELYNSTQAPLSRDAAGGAVKFAVPTIANGRVYVPNSNQVTVYGLLP